ncbi:MAG TPA: 4'-phosphopantetheinyl transferase superfamily protein [Chthoniobacterales bacterium]
MNKLSYELTPGRVFLVRGTGEDWRGRVLAWCERLFGLRDLEFAYQEFGKPYFKNHPELAFSVSHTRTALCAAFCVQEIGLDVEFRDRRIRALSLAGRYFHPPETGYLRGLAEDAHAAAFLSLWTAKEACVKLTGEGIYRGLPQCHVEPSSAPANAVQNGRPAFLRQQVWADGLIATVAAWSEFQLECLEQSFDC